MKMFKKLGLLLALCAFLLAAMAFTPAVQEEVSPETPVETATAQEAESEAELEMLMSTQNNTTPHAYHLQIDNWGKSGSYWHFKIGIQSTSCYYNTKMANFNDAKFWVGLNHVELITLAIGTRDIYVQTNFFATTVAFSQVIDEVRYITYAHELINNQNIKNMTVYYNIVPAPGV